jgi:hypothetical protein
MSLTRIEILIVEEATATVMAGAMATVMAGAMATATAMAGAMEEVVTEAGKTAETANPTTGQETEMKETVIATVPGTTEAETTKQDLTNIFHTFYSIKFLFFYIFTSSCFSCEKFSHFCGSFGDHFDCHSVPHRT